jgi:hypothetical protein
MEFLSTRAAITGASFNVLILLISSIDRAPTSHNSGVLRESVEIDFPSEDSADEAARLFEEAMAMYAGKVLEK